MTIAIDGSAKGQVASASSVSASLTTAGGGLVIAIVQATGPATFPPYLNFDGAQLTDAQGKVSSWHLQYSVPADYPDQMNGNGATTYPSGYQVWWGISSGSMTANSFTATFGQSKTNASLIVFGVSGANTSKPFDSNTSIFPGSLSCSTGFSTNKTRSFSTSCTNAMVVVVEGTGARPGPSDSISAGYTLIQKCDNASTNGISCAQKVVAATQSNLQLQLGTVGGTQHVIMGFAIAAAGETACTDTPPMAMVGSAARNGASTSGSTIAASLTTQNAEGIVLAIVGRDSNQAVTMSGSNVGTWVQYTTHNVNTDGYVDIWWAPVTGVMTANSITATLAGNVTKRSIVLMQLVNTSLSNPFDNHASLPSKKTGNGGTASATAMSSTNGNVMGLFVSYDAIHSASNSGFTGFVAPDASNPSATVETKVARIAGGNDGGGDVFVNVTWSTAAFSSFAPNLGDISTGDWLTITAAIGPSPPLTGTMAPTEAKDTLAVVGSLQGGSWGSTETKDHFAGNGHSEGPLIVTEAKDTASFSGYLNPIGSWASTEAKDTWEGHIASHTPLFVSAGAIANVSFSSNITPVLPASLNVGNYMLCFVSTFSPVTITAAAGWSVLDSFTGSSLSGTMFYRFVDGTEVNPTFTLSSPTDVHAKIWQFSGVITVGAIRRVDDGGNAVNWSNPGVTSTAEHSLVVAMWYGNNGGTTTGTPTGYTTISSETRLAMFRQNVDVFGTPSTPIVNQPVSFSMRNMSYEIELCSALPPIFMTWASIGAKDEFSGVASLVGGSWSSTEAKDALHVLGWVPLFFGIDANETPDFGNFQVYIPPRGTWASTETADISGFDGQPTPVIGVDAHAMGGDFNATNGPGITTASVTITTNYTHDIIVLAINCGGFWTHRDVATVTDTAGLVWKRRVKRQYLSLHIGAAIPDVSGDGDYFEVWWAHKPTKGATTITVTTSGQTGAIVLDATAVKGANVDTPFDTHSGNGWWVDTDGDIFDQDGSGHIGNPHFDIWSDSSKMCSLAYHISNDHFPDTSVPAGWTFLGRKAETEHQGSTLNLGSMAQSFFTQQFGEVDTWFGPDATHISNRALHIETLIASDQTAGTNDVVRWYFDGIGNRLIEQFIVGQSSVTFGSGGLVSRRRDSMAIVAVMTLSSLGARVESITDVGNHSGWTRRSIVTNESGTISLEVWWVELGSVPLNGTMTLHMDSNIRGGDVVSATCFAVNGTNISLRNEIWDPNGSLPAVNRGITGHQTVGPFSTSNDNVLILSFGANIDATFNNTDIRGRQPFPYLFLPPPAELASDGPPTFHIGTSFKFNGPVVTDASTEFDVSPSAQSWLMIADALLVGPTSPPHGSLIVNEFRDRFEHNGNFTAIGIASPGGWIGFPPNQGDLVATDAKDEATNSGAFTAIWAMDDGWIGYIPAFMEMETADTDDTLLYRAWVLGPRTIIGHMHADEAKDRFALSTQFSFFTTPDSVGDRTSRITVTTNAALAAGNVQSLVDGSMVDFTGSFQFLNGAQAAPVEITFDFGGPRILTEIRWYQNGPFAQPGQWHTRASNDNVNWTVLSNAPYNLTGSSTGDALGVFDISNNITGYRYYQIQQTTNAGTSSIPQIREAQFKVGGVVGTMGATEAKDRIGGYMLAIPTATPLPARKRQMLIVT